MAGSNLFRNNQMSLGLSQVQNQNQLSSNVLRLGTSAKFEHLNIPPISDTCSFGQPMPSPALYMPDSNQACFPNKPSLHGLMQLPDLQTNTNNSSTHSNLFNISFFSNNTGANLSSSSGLLIPDELNNNGMGDHVGSGVSSLFSNSNSILHPENIASHMSATALLQKASQIGSTTSSNNSSLLRGVATSSSDKQNSLVNLGFSFGSGNGGGMENASHLQGLMNSLANVNSSMFRGQDNNFDGFTQERERRHSNTDFSTAGSEPKFAVSTFGGSDKLTLDFLGVGGMVRNMGAGYSQREHQHAININSFEPDASQPFASTTLEWKHIEKKQNDISRSITLLNFACSIVEYVGEAIDITFLFFIFLLTL
jgi:hypothetical protein